MMVHSTNNSQLPWLPSQSKAPTSRIQVRKTKMSLLRVQSLKGLVQLQSRLASHPVRSSMEFLEPVKSCRFLKKP